MDLVIVESPAKAKTINKYLGHNFKVLASFGHIRDLPGKDGSVDTQNDFAMIWQIDGKSEKHIKDIAAAARQAGTIYLATDPDREGEAISWHINEELIRRRALKGKPVKRVVFHEITKKAILEAVSAPRMIKTELVEAYLARRALDYLVGFNLSPVLWRKLPGARSAGRVQSVALRLICEREEEIEAFTPQEFWSLEADFNTPADQKFRARLTRLYGQKLEKFSLGNAGAAAAAKSEVEKHAYQVGKVERREVKRNPYAPFITSTLQQEASRKLGFGARRTMQIAQKLYEGISLGGETQGLITYMRTDSVVLSGDALGATRALIAKQYGAPYLPEKPRLFNNKAKNAQEAHEAIRPTDLFRTPGQVRAYLDQDQFRLYDLIWKRTVASQMAQAVFDQMSVDVSSGDGSALFRATGSVLKFDGFLTLYQEGRDDQDDGKDADDKDRRLPPMQQADKPVLQKADIEQHFTQPPPRFTEASLVKRLEELGIGRPSTYALIISVLQDRDYVTLERKRFQPSERGRLVTVFLNRFFERYVQYNFTAEMENRLDEISNGRAAWKQVLSQFWTPFHKSVEGARDLKFSDVLDELDQQLEHYLFPPDAAGGDPRACPKCAEGRLSLRLGKFGAFLGCSDYPTCKFTRQLATEEGEAGDFLADGPKLLGRHPEHDKDVTLRKGPYGFYVQLGEEEEGQTKTGKPKKIKPKRAALAKGQDPTIVDLQQAVSLLSLPREVGVFPDTGEVIKANIGRFGPYVQAGSIFASLTKDDDVLTVGENRAVALIADKKQKAGKELGKHPADNKPIMIAEGRWGPYVKHGKVNATLPKDVEKTQVTVDMAVGLLAAKAGAKTKKGTAKKAATKKTGAKKTTARKTRPKKETA